MRDLIRYAVALASIGAGVIHLTAAAAHGEHRLVFAFFVATGVLQLGWGGLAASKNMPRWIFDLGGLGNALVIGTWLASRVSGLPIGGADHAEPIQIKDAVATLLEVFVVVGVGMLLLAGRSRKFHMRIPLRATTPLAAALAVLIVPGVVLPAHHHRHDGHSHIAAAGQSHAKAGEHPLDGSEGTHADGHSSDGASAAAGHAHEKAQEHAGAAAATHEHGSSPPASVEKAPVKKVDEVQGIAAKVRYGPFVLPPASLGGSAHYNRVLTGVAKPCSTNCYLLEAKPDLVYDDGSSANLNTGPMLHHAVWTRPSINDSTCGRNSGIGSQGERFFASGNERTRLGLPAGFGYPIANDPWNLIVEVMNHSQQPKNVYIELAVKYRPLSDGLRQVRPIWLDVGNCKSSEFAVPAGKSHTVWEWTSSITGRIVSAGGHVHDGGVKTVLRNETTTKHVCTSVAGYGKKPAFDGAIESMSTCIWDKIGTVRSGETLGLHAYYDSSRAQSDVMGIMMAFVHETSDLSSGSAPPDGDQPEEPDPPPVHDH